MSFVTDGSKPTSPGHTQPIWWCGCCLLCFSEYKLPTHFLLLSFIVVVFVWCFSFGCYSNLWSVVFVLLLLLRAACEWLEIVYECVVFFFFFKILRYYLYLYTMFRFHYSVSSSLIRCLFIVWTDIETYLQSLQVLRALQLHAQTTNSQTKQNFNFRNNNEEIHEKKNRHTTHFDNVTWLRFGWLRWLYLQLLLRNWILTNDRHVQMFDSNRLTVVEDDKISMQNNISLIDHDYILMEN